MVASETQVLEESNGSTHIYCNSPEVNGDLISNTNAQGLDRESNKHIHVDAISPSASTDADGRKNLISRMSSIGRSLIQVDFLTWRKKKKYSRRNSLGNEKDSFQNMVIEDYCDKNILPRSGHLAVLDNNPFTFKSADKLNNGVSPEKNNNKSNTELNALMGRIPKENQIEKKEDNESFASDENSLSVSSTPTIVQGKCKQNSKTKLHSHLPISTFSAAMNVAVEMRYDENCQKNDLQSSNNISNFSHSKSNEDQSPRTNPKRIYNTISLKNDQLQDCKNNKQRFQGKCRHRKNEMTKDEIKKNKISEASSSTSLRSTNITAKNKDSSYSTKFVALLISSDESDDDFTHITQATKIHSSSASLNTQSNESLNSLLSETGELNSSTNTLCSVVNEYVNIPIAPLPMTVSATPEENFNKEPVLPQSDLKEKSNKLSSNIHDGCKNSTGPNIVKSEQKLVQGTFTLPEQSNKCQRINTSIIQSSTNGIKAFSRKETNNIKKNNILNELADNLPELNEEPNERPMLTQQPARNCNLKSSNLKMGLEVPSSIPQKYRHQITVTPIKRDKWKVNNHNKLLDFDNNSTNPQRSLRDLCVRHGSINKGNFREMNAERQAFSELTIKSKSAARVAFDLDGKVIYSRASSARKNRQVKTNETVHNATNKLESSQDTNHSQINELIVRNRNNYNPKDIDKMYRSDLSNHYKQRNLSQNSSLLLNNNLDYSLGLTHGNEFQTICDFPKLENSSKLKMETFKPIIPTTKSNEVVGKSFDTFLLPTSTKPDPNISGLPKNKNTVPSANIQHEFQAEKINYFPSKESEDAQTVTNFSPSLKQSSKENEHIKSPVSTMSSEDLFALIYEYKKKLNIKTNLDISKPLSRSSSPFCYGPNSSKGVLAETGFISTQNPTQLQISGNRKSWADFRPVDNQISTRKSLASDRLGPPKPTSLHDFKMLLLQTRNHMISEPHKSAVELLKHPSPQDSQEFIKPSRPMSVRNSISFPVSRAAKEAINDGHSTVPFKRGSKARISLQAQYFMYPPIFEDHLEDIEVSSDKENKTNGEQASERKSTFNEWRAS